MRVRLLRGSRNPDLTVPEKRQHYVPNAAAERARAQFVSVAHCSVAARSHSRIRPLLSALANCLLDGAYAIARIQLVWPSSAASCRPLTMSRSTIVPSLAAADELTGALQRLYSACVATP
jgi:hypothetical protein